MEDDEEFDGMLLVQALYGGPGYLRYWWRAPGILDFVGLGLTIVSVLAVALILLAPYIPADQKFRALGVALIGSNWAFWALGIAGLLYPLYKIWDAADTSKIRQHIFTSDGIELARSDSTSLLPWNTISRAVETPKGFLFYQRSRLAAFVPCRCLQGDAEINIIRKFAGKYIANAKLLA
jgi:YcxB-like protein